MLLKVVERVLTFNKVVLALFYRGYTAAAETRVGWGHAAKHTWWGWGGAACKLCAPVLFHRGFTAAVETRAG